MINDCLDSTIMIVFSAIDKYCQQPSQLTEAVIVSCTKIFMFCDVILVFFPINGWVDDLQFLCPFQQYFSHIRTMG